VVPARLFQNRSVQCRLSHLSRYKPPDRSVGVGEDWILDSSHWCSREASKVGGHQWVYFEHGRPVLLASPFQLTRGGDKPLIGQCDDLHRHFLQNAFHVTFALHDAKESSRVFGSSSRRSSVFLSLTGLDIWAMRKSAPTIDLRGSHLPV
jgi:hypothetical protein